MRSAPRAAADSPARVRVGIRVKVRVGVRVTVRVSPGALRPKRRG